MSCVTAQGYINAAAALQGARFQASLINSITPVVTALDAANNAIEIAKKRFNIAGRQVSLAEEQLAFNELAWPCENSAINEANSAPGWSLKYDVVTGRAAVPIKAEFAKQRAKLKKGYSRYNLGALQTQLKKMCVAEEIAASEAKNIAWRTEQAKADAQSDKNWNRRIEMAGLGKGLSSQISSLYGSASNGLAGAQQAAGNAFNRALGQLGGVWEGYGTQDPYVQRRFIQAEGNNAAQGLRMDSQLGLQMGGGTGLQSNADLYPSGFSMGASNSIIGAEAYSLSESAINISGPGEGMQIPSTPDYGNTVFSSDIGLQPDSTIKFIPEKQFFFSRFGNNVRVGWSEDELNPGRTNAKNNDLPSTNIAGHTP